MSSAQILNNPWVWYNDNTPPKIKMLNQNITPHGTEATRLRAAVAVLIANMGDDRHSANVGCAFFRYTNAELKNHTNQRSKNKTWAREDNQLVLHCYFRSNPTQRGYRKRMIEIWQECASFQTC